MPKYGTAPFLECSSRGDQRFSIFYARLRCYGGLTIEHIYQSYKKFEDGKPCTPSKLRGGSKAINQEEVNIIYQKLWSLYFSENPELVRTLISLTGIVDIYPVDAGGLSQSEVLWSIRERFLSIDVEEWIKRRLV